MLMQIVLITFTLSSYTGVIDGSTIHFSTSGLGRSTNQREYLEHREKRQINPFVFNGDLGQVLTRTINNINLIRDTIQYSRDLSSSISNVFNPMNGTADASGIYPNSPLRAFQGRFEELRKRTRDSLYQYMKRMGIL